MLDIRNKIRTLLSDRRVVYLIVGGINTVFGYSCSNLLYYTLTPALHIIIIGIISNIICITFSFLTYKFFVFKTKGKWLAEYLKCYLVYGMAAVLSLFLVWGLVDGLDIPFWLAQGLVMILSVAFSYFGHSRFSFADRSKATEKNLEVQADDQK